MRGRNLLKSAAILQILAASHLATAPVANAGLCEDFLNYASYAFEKLREVPYMGRTEIHLAQLVTETLRTSKPKKVIAVPIGSIQGIHPLSEDRATVQNKLKARIETLKSKREEIEAQRSLTQKLLDQLVPSVTPIMVVKDRAGNYVTIEGNGRMEAVRQAFADRPDFTVEVTFYETDSPRVLELIETIRSYSSDG